MRVSWKRPAFAIALFALLMVLASCASNGATPVAQDAGNTVAVNKGKPAPQFDLKDMDGNEVTLSSLAGHKVYVKYWASWCPICLAGMDELNRLAAQSNDFKVITIVSPNYKGEKSEEDFKEWFKGLQAQGTATNITVLLDDDGKWAQEFGVRGYPTSIYIGSDGMLIKSVPGHNTNDAITEEFKHIS